jgi:hypothetical protein
MEFDEARYQDLANRSVTRARQFDWSEIARQTADLYLKHLGP